MSEIRVLILGDVIGQPGCRALFFSLDRLKKEFGPDHIIVNGENAADGFGITPEQADLFFSKGVDVITSGNHIWQKKEIFPILDQNEHLLRPENYPSGNPGHGWCFSGEGEKKIAVMNLQGRIRMNANLDSPFKVTSKLLSRLRKETKAILIDFHAEDASEKEALAIYLDGQISALVGTHTHVQTADERIFEKGTAYISDLGYVGVKSGVIGTDPALAVKRAQTQMPIRSEIVEGDTILCGAFIRIESETGKALSIDRVRI